MGLRRAGLGVLALGVAAALAWADVVTPEESSPTPSDLSVQAALQRARTEAESEGPARGEVLPTPTARLRVWSSPSAGDPLYRNGVPYFDEWTIRAGASHLRVPAYPGWERAKPNSGFYEQQAAGAVPGEHLATALLNNAFQKLAKTRYPSFYSLIWVPQEFAFTLMAPESFSAFKAQLQEETVAVRKRVVERADFKDFEDYLNFKFGYDEEVDAFVDGYWIRAVDKEDMVMYFATSEFTYQTPRTEIVDPMIMTATYALVENKLLRVDMKRLYRSENDIAALIAFSQQFVEDMRRLNGLSDEVRTWR